MKTNKQILMLTIVIVILAMATVFTGCKKVEVTAVQARPFAVMLPVNSNTTLCAYFEPSDATECSMKWSSDNPNIVTVKQQGRKGSEVLVTAHALGETTITGKAKNVEYPTYTTVIINPIEDVNDYATLVPRFYFGAFNNQYMVGGFNYITVKYHSKNKILFSFGKSVVLYPTEEGVNCYIQADYVAGITKNENYTYSFVGEINVTIEGKTYPASIEGTFYPSIIIYKSDYNNLGLDLFIKVKNFPELEDKFIRFEGTGSFTVGEGTGIWHC